MCGGFFPAAAVRLAMRDVARADCSALCSGASVALCALCLDRLCAGGNDWV